MRIDPRLWPRLSPLLDEWLDLPRESRRRWVENLGPEYEDVLPAFEDLLRDGSAAESGDFLSTLPMFHGARFAPDMTVGPYRLVRELGTGGMGVVWLAERADGSIQRPIALKLPLVPVRHPGMGERFARERDILAQLEHPHIARLYDAGVALDGRPYLAIEYVEGEPVTAWCDRECSSVQARLHLFVTVVRAVQYAHSRLVVHRDLKPSNILVTKAGGVRLLDFGIAKLLIEGQAEETELTRIAGRAMTPDFASPEQIAGDAITTASDVYSLGVILYELLCGERPYRLKRNTLAGLEEAIVGTETVRPSQAVGDGAKALVRGSNPKRLAKALRGDLDWIVLKALRKQPVERYATADAFAQDIERYLAGEPILARAESAWRRARKFVRRNKPAVASAAAVVAALSVGLGVALWQTHVAILQKQRAETEATTSKALNDFLQNDLLAQASPRTQAGPARKPDPELTVRDALDRAAARIPGKFPSQPAVEASIRHTIGLTYRDLGLYAEARQQLERAVELRRRVLGAEHPDTVSSMSELGLLYFSEGKFARAEALLTPVLAIQRRDRGTEHPETLATMNDLAIIAGRQGDYARAVTLLDGVLKIQRRVLGEEHPDTLAVTNNLASNLLSEGKYAEAAELYRKAAEGRLRVLGPQHPATLASLNNLAIAYRNLGDYTRAGEILTAVLETRRHILGERHPDTLDSMSSQALLYQAEGKYAQAEPILEQVVEGRRRVLGEEHSTTLLTLNHLAELFRREGKLERAGTLFNQLLNVRLRVTGPDHANTASVLSSLGAIELERQHYSDAEPLLRRALSAFEKSAPDNWRRYYVESLLGAALAGQRRCRDAPPLLASGYRGLIERQATVPFDERPAIQRAGAWTVQPCRD
jgi:serine/threonine protein kinase/Tfp pilus assembly protein PilF